MKKILAVVGSRTFDDYTLLKETLDKLDFDEIVSGGAPGADTMSEQYAHDNNIPLKVFGAEWKLHGKRAGMIRNKMIVDYCHEAVAFWNQRSTGTAHTIECLKDLNRPHKIVLF